MNEHKNWLFNVANTLLLLLMYIIDCFSMIFRCWNSFPVHFYTFSATIKLNVDLEMFILTLILSRFILLAVPPDRPIIYESKRKEKAKNVEAYNEGSDVLLICEVTGGKCWFPNQIFSDIRWQIMNTRLKNILHMHSPRCEQFGFKYIRIYIWLRVQAKLNFPNISEIGSFAFHHSNWWFLMMKISYFKMSKWIIVFTHCTSFNKL